MRNPMFRTISADEALTVINGHNALIKNIETTNPSAEPPFSDNNNGWGFLVRQLQDPENYRPARSVPTGADRTCYFNPQDHTWYTRVVKQTKGLPKPGAKFTKKTATSLLPPDGKMTLYSQTHGVAILFDINKCYLKQYIFDRNVRSNDRWWLYGANNGKSKPFSQGGKQLTTSVSLNEIRRQHQDAMKSGETPKWNEILPGLATDAIIGVAAPSDDLLRRLNAQYRKLILRRELSVDVPIFIVTPGQKKLHYTETMQLEDLARAEQKSEISIEHDFLKSIQALKKQVNSIHQAVRDNDLDKISQLLSHTPNAIFEVEDNKTPAQLAAELDRWDCITAMAFNAKESEEYKARYGDALLEAARNTTEDAKSAALALVKANASIRWSYSKGNYPGYYPIHFSVLNHNIELLDALLQKHGEYAANLQHTTVTPTPLSLAIQKNNIDAVTALLKNGAEINALENNAAENAAIEKRWPIVFTYINQIADANKQKEIAGQLLHEAVRQNDVDAITFLCAKNPNLSEKNGKTPIQLAIELDHWDCVKTITEKLQLNKDDVKKYSDALLEKYRQRQTHESHSRVSWLQDCRSDFQKGISDIQHKEAVTKKLVILEADLSKQIENLTDEIKKSFFSHQKIVKTQKKSALEEILKLIKTQLKTGNPCSSTKFNNILSKKKGWDSGFFSNRTGKLVRQAKLLTPEKCSKLFGNS